MKLPSNPLYREFFEETLKAWGDLVFNGYSPAHPPRKLKVVAAIETIDDALKKLGTRDRGGVKAQLTADRERLTAALGVFISLDGEREVVPPCAFERDVGFHCDGPVAVELAARSKREQSAVASARSAFELATGDDVAAARATLDRAEASNRAFFREVAAIRDAARFPALPDFMSPANPRVPDVTILDRARTDTQDLSTNGRPLMSTHRALEQGLRTPRNIARLWICFETNSKLAELYDLRWRMFVEEHGE